MKSRYLIYLGVLLLLIGFVYPMATLQTIAYTSTPEDGGTYEALTTVSITTPTTYGNDEWSKVHYWEDGSFKCLLSPLGIVEGKIWTGSHSNPSVGGHTFEFKLYAFHLTAEGIPKEYIADTVSGSFTMTEPSEGLQGNWYVNDILIESSADVITTTNLTVTFKFVRSVGTVSPTVSVRWTGPETGSITIGTADGVTWEYIRNFGHYGTYQVDLIASDGANIIKLSVFYTATNGGEPTAVNEWLRIQNIFIIAGVLLIGYGLIKQKRG